MNYLTAEQILFLHARLVTETGGLHGVRDLSMLESATARPKATFGEKDLYPDIFTKAAALLDSLINDHPFVGGNKRTGIAAAALFLRRNGYHLKAEAVELENFTLSVAIEHPDPQIITSWLKEHTLAE